MSSLSRAFAKVGGTTLLSRLLGFARDLIIARVFGATAATDAFFIAFRIPNLLRRLFAEGAFALVLVPWLEHERRKQDTAHLRDLFDRLSGTLAVLLALLTLLGVLGAPLLVLAFAPGFAHQPDQHALTTALVRLTLPYVLFITLTALAGAMLNLHGRFGIPAFTPALLNLSLIAAALWLAPRLAEPILALAWGLLIAGMLQLALQLAALARLGLLPRPRVAFSDRRLHALAAQTPPTLLSVSVVQIGLLIDSLLASFLDRGSISWLYYAERLMEFPLGILAAALGIVMLPRLSEQHVEADPRAFARTLDWGLRWVLLLGLPAAVGLAVLSEPLMASLFVSDAFGAQDARGAAEVLAAYALGLTALMALKVLAPVYYARHDRGRPLRAAGAALGVNLALSLMLMIPLGPLGLALATALSAWVNALWLLIGLKGQGADQIAPEWARLLLGGCGSSALMGLALWPGIGTLDDWLALDAAERLLHLAAWILAGAALYALLLLIAGVRPRHLAHPT